MTSRNGIVEKPGEKNVKALWQQRKTTGVALVTARDNMASPRHLIINKQPAP